MATWTDVSSTVLEPGDPIRSVDIIAIKENIIALSEGASGAPAIQTDALTSSERMNTTNVLAATAGASAGSVGTYVFAAPNTGASTINAGTTVAGSTLNYCGIAPPWVDFSNTSQPTRSFYGSALSGTWRCMGLSGHTDGNIDEKINTLWLRIS